MMNFDKVPSLGETNTIVKDFSRYGNHGTAINGPVWTSNGRRGGAFMFNGVNNYLTIQSNEKIEPIEELSIDMFVKIYDTSDRQIILRKSIDDTW